MCTSRPPGSTSEKSLRGALVGYLRTRSCSPPLVNATGTWTRPFVPFYPGIDAFAGEQVHTAHYPGVDHFRGTPYLDRLLEILGDALRFEDPEYLCLLAAASESAFPGGKSTPASRGGDSIPG